MNRIDFDLFVDNKLNCEDLVIISYFELIANTEGDGESFNKGYSEIIKDLPLIFQSKSENANIKKLRSILNKEGVKQFVTREIKQQGRGKGALTTFKLDIEKTKKLNVKGIVK